MSQKTTEAARIGAMLKSESTRAIAIREVVTALREHGGNVAHAARALDVSVRGLAHWVSQYDEIFDAIEKIRKRAGHPIVKLEREGAGEFGAVTTCALPGCGVTFEAVASWQKYCCPEHRQAASTAAQKVRRRKRRAAQPSAR